MRSCIYRITNMVTGHNYIGSTSDYATRVWHHRKALREDRHHSKLLQHAWNFFGEDEFEFAMIEEVPVDRLSEYEQYYMDNMDTTYNVLKVAGSSLGWSRTRGNI